MGRVNQGLASSSGTNLCGGPTSPCLRPAQDKPFWEPGPPAMTAMMAESGWVSSCGPGDSCWREVPMSG